MVYLPRLLNDPFTQDLYEYLMSYAPLNYLEHHTNLWEEDIYFVLNSNLPTEKYDKNFLAGFEVNYTNH